MVLAPRAVVVHRRTELDELIGRHATRGQAKFFLRTRGRTLADVQRRHDACVDAMSRASRAIPVDWRRGSVERADLERFLFGPNDVVIVVGQDGLVANTAKYLAGQPVLGLNPEPDRNPGVLVKFPPTQAARLLDAIASGRALLEKRTLVRADVDDGQQLVALNEIYVGHPGHQSARYCLTEPGFDAERQSSSGVIIGTGTGATGWCASIARGRRIHLTLPGPEERALCWFVREAWPSPATGTTHTEGPLRDDEHLTIDIESDGLVIFGDGLEGDRLTVNWGHQITLGVDSHTLRLVAGLTP